MPNPTIDGIEASLNKEIKEQDRPSVKFINPIDFKVNYSIRSISKSIIQFG